MSKGNIHLQITNPHVLEWLNTRLMSTGATAQGYIRNMLYQQMMAERKPTAGLADKVWVHEKGGDQ